MSVRADGPPPRLLGERIWGAILKWRDDRIADRAFRRRATTFPLTRHVATRSATTLFDLTAGFVYSQILKALVELDILALLSEQPRTAEEVAQSVSLPPERAARLLDAAAALDLLERRGDGRYGLGVLGGALNGEPGVRAMIAHHDMLYADLADPVALLRGEKGGTALSRFWAYAGGPGAGLKDSDVAAYSDLMAQSQSFVADDVLDVALFGDRNSLLDMAGGEGRFAEAAARRWPHLKVSLFELPAVAERARAHLDKAGLGERVAVHAGDLKTDALPKGFDVVSLVRVLHDHDDAAALTILKAAHAALEPHGEIMIAEPLAEMPGAKRVGHAYFGFYLMAMGSGRPRTPAEVADLLHAAGFWNVRSRFTRGAPPLGVVTARRAGEGPVWRI